VPFDTVGNIFEVKMQICPVEFGMHGVGWGELLSAPDLIQTLFQFVNFLWLKRP
jgi:hypothetical protein